VQRSGALGCRHAAVFRRADTPHIPAFQERWNVRRVGASGARNARSRPVGTPERRNTCSGPRERLRQNGPGRRNAAGSGAARCAFRRPGVSQVLRVPALWLRVPALVTRMRVPAPAPPPGTLVPERRAFRVTSAGTRGRVTRAATAVDVIKTRAAGAGLGPVEDT
jgi:hypothetical protein